MDLAVASNGDILVADQGNRRVQRFDSNGTYLSQLGSAGTGNGQFSTGPAQPGQMSLAADGIGNIYVSDSSRVQKFNAIGTFVTKWLVPAGGNSVTGLAVDPAGSNIFLVFPGTTLYRSLTTPDPPGATIPVFGPPPGGMEIGTTEGADATAGVPLHFFVRLTQGTITLAQWDLDGDETYEGKTTNYDPSGFVAHYVGVYPQGGLHSVFVRVDLADGLAYRWYQNIEFLDEVIGVSIDDGAQYTNSPHVTLNLVAPAGAKRALISNDGGFSPATTVQIAASKTTVHKAVAWTLASSGAERLPKTAYVRYSGMPGNPISVQDDIILDQTPPTVTSATVSGGSAVPAAFSASSPSRVNAVVKRTFNLRLNARDNVSGVRWVQVTVSKGAPGKWLPYKKAMSLVRTKRPKWVRVRDRAGNKSAWRAIK